MRTTQADGGKMGCAPPPRTKTRRLQIGPWVYRSETFSDGTLRVITKWGRFVWRNRYGMPDA